MNFFLSVFLTLFGAVSLFAEDKQTEFAYAEAINRQVVPIDTTMRKGMLDNGLTYYVVQNNRPEKRVSLRLIVKGGSLVEEENERGIAHYVEHVVFKGSKHFPETQDVLGFLRRNGMPLGHDSNAFTGHEQTWYIFNDIPTDNNLLVDSCLLFLRDVAGDATLDDKAIEEERGVITEEWRIKNTKAYANEIQHTFFNNSLYSERLSIGDMDIVQNCLPSLVRNFYKRWYQPQNMAVVVAGDFEPDEMVAKICARFSDMKRGETTLPALPAIPDTEAPTFHVFGDEMSSGNIVTLMIRLPQQTPKEHPTVNDLKEAWMQDRINNIMQWNKMPALSKNYDEITYCGSSLNDVPAVSNLKVMEITAMTPAGGWRAGLELILRQVELIRRKGFTDDDWNRSYYRNVLTEDSAAINFADTTRCHRFRTNGDWAGKLSDNFAKGKAILSLKTEEMTDFYLDMSIAAEELTQAFRTMTDGRNMTVYTILPADDEQPTETELREVYDRVKQMTDEELTLTVKPEAKPFGQMSVDSIHIDPTPGTLRKFRILNDSISEALLSNGVKVVFWKTEGDDMNRSAWNYPYLKITRPSGFSVLSDEDYPLHFFLDGCTRRFRTLRSNDGWLNIGEWQDSYSFSASQLDMAYDLFKVVHATLTPTEIDTVAFQEARKKLHISSQSFHNPLTPALLGINYLYAAGPWRHSTIPPTDEQLDSFTPDHLKAIVDDYYSNWNGSVLVVQSQFDTDILMPSVLKYIASLPSKKQPARHKVWPSDHYRTADTTFVGKIPNNTPFCQTIMYYTLEKGYKYTPETHARNQVLQNIISTQLLNVLRVEHSDVYTPTCTLTDDLLPVSRMRFNIMFTCDPTRRERIAKDVQRLMHDMAEGKFITQDLIDSYIKQRERDKQPENRKLREQEINALINRELYGFAMDESDLSYIRSVTPASLKTHLKRLLKKGNLHIGYLTTE